MISISSQYAYRNKYQNVWHLAYYISSEHKTNGTISNSLIKFKDKVPNYPLLWTHWAVAEFQKEGVEIDVIVRALASEEVSCSRNEALDYLGTKLANAVEAKYMPEILAKRRANQSLKKLKRDQREEVLKDNYYIADTSKLSNGDTILIIDDVSTSGTTVNTIRKVLKDKYPNSPIYAFFLCKTTDDVNGNVNVYEEAQVRGLKSIDSPVLNLEDDDDDFPF